MLHQNEQRTYQNPAKRRILKPYGKLATAFILHLNFAKVLKWEEIIQIDQDKWSGEFGGNIDSVTWMELNHGMPWKLVDSSASCHQHHLCAIHVLTWSAQEAGVGHLHPKS